MSFSASADHAAAPDDSRRRAAGRLPRRARIRLGAVSAAAALGAAVLSVPGPAGAAAGAPAGPAFPAAPGAYGTRAVLALRAMPAGRVIVGRDRHHRLTVRAAVFGLTPGSSHGVDLSIPGRPGLVRFSPLTANSVGQAASTLSSGFRGRWQPGSRLLIRMGAGGSRVAGEPIAVTNRLRHPGHRVHWLRAVEVSRRGISYGTPHGGATLVYNRHRHTLTVTIHAGGVTPGPHAAHIHLGSCVSQGPVAYMLRDLVANRRGQIVHAVRVLTNVMTPIPAHGWYLNIHQGNSGNILRNGQPTIFFRPLLCSDIKG